MAATEARGKAAMAGWETRAPHCSNKDDHRETRAPRPEENRMEVEKEWSLHKTELQANI